MISRTTSSKTLLSPSTLRKRHVVSLKKSLLHASKKDIFSTKAVQPRRRVCLAEMKLSKKNDYAPSFRLSNESNHLFQISPTRVKATCVSNLVSSAKIACFVGFSACSSVVMAVIIASLYVYHGVANALSRLVIILNSYRIDLMSKHLEAIEASICKANLDITSAFQAFVGKPASLKDLTNFIGFSARQCRYQDEAISSLNNSLLGRTLLHQDDFKKTNELLTKLKEKNELLALSACQRARESLADDILISFEELKDEYKRTKDSTDELDKLMVVADSSGLFTPEELNDLKLQIELLRNS